MQRIVLDTNILASGLRSREGASFVLLRLVADRRIRPLVTTTLFLEYEAVLKRPDQQQASGFSVAEIDVFLTEFSALCEAVEVHFLWRPQLADPQDEMVLEAAVNGRADALITHNIRDFRFVAPRFAVKILRPGAFLEGVLS